MTDSIRLPCSGIGCFLYLMLVEKLELHAWPSILSAGRQLQLSLPYVAHMLKNPRSTRKALALLQHVLSCCSTNSMKVIELEDSSFFLFVQQLISFMVDCPVQEIRSEGYRLLTVFVSLFEDTTRFVLLQKNLESCPYASVKGLFVSLIKNEVIKAWNTSSLVPSYFVSPKVLDILPKLTSTRDIHNSIDTIIAVLNFFRFILIKDKTSNLTGVWESDKILSLNQEFLLPLQKKC